METVSGYVMGGTKYSLMVFYSRVLSKGGKHYCQPGIKAIKNRLAQYQKIFLGESWLYKAIADLERRGFIKRRKRIYRNSSGELISKKSLISITIEGYNYLISRDNKAASQLRKQLIAFINGDDKRFPHPGSEAAPAITNGSKSKMNSLGDIFKNIVNLVI